MSSVVLRQPGFLDLGIDPEAERFTQSAVTSLVPDGALGGVRLPRLQQFLWHELPIYWIADLELHLAVAAELAERFTAEGMTEHAEVCTSTRTEQIIWAYGTVGHDAGLEAYCEAILEASPAPTVSAAWDAAHTTKPLHV
ncbi:MAG: hypothetical protein ACOC9R_02015 [bacterium]